MRRGDLVPVALQGDMGKPRPALVIQSNLFDDHPSVVILPVTSTLVDAPLFRIAVAPSKVNGLKKPSQIMADKPQTVSRNKLGAPFGCLEDEKLLEATRAVALFIGIADR